MDVLIFSNLVAPLITGLFFLLYFIYFIIANPSKAASYRYFVVFMIAFSLFIFGRPMQLILGSFPIPLIIVNIRVFILCSVISPVIMLTVSVFNKKRTRYMDAIIISICFLLGLTYVVFNTLGTTGSYVLFNFAGIVAHDNLTPSLMPPFFGREITIAVQVITGILLFVFSLVKLVILIIENSFNKFIKNKIFLMNTGILIFALSFIIGSLTKQWWIYYAVSILSALLFGASVLIDIKEFHNHYDKLIPFIKEDIIHSIPFSDFSMNKLTEMLNYLGKRPNLDTFIILKIKEKDNSELHLDLKSFDDIIDIIKKHLNNILDEENYLILPLSNNKISIVLRLLKETSDKQVYIMEELEQIQEEIAGKVKSKISIGIGRSYQKIEDLKISYHEALNAQQHSEQLDTSNIIHVENISEFNQHTSKYPVKEKERLLSLIRLGDIENSKIALKDFYAKFKAFIDEKPEILKVRLFELAGSLIDSALLGGGDEKKLNELTAKYLDEINNLNDINSVKDWLTKMVLEAVDIVVNIYERRSKVLIDRAKKYIEDNYKIHLSYKDVAKELFISPSYFLTLFKQEADFTFVDYLTNVRISKAKELLLSTELTITEIAYEVGFNNSNYFSNIFRKTVGIPAKDYRRKVSAKGGADRPPPRYKQ